MRNLETFSLPTWLCGATPVVGIPGATKKKTGKGKQGEKKKKKRGEKGEDVDEDGEDDEDGEGVVGRETGNKKGLEGYARWVERDE